MDGFEHSDLDIQWKKVLVQLSKSFEDVNELKDIMFLIGVQELGSGYRTLSKDEKIDVIHIGICQLLSRHGYYEFIGRDSEGWPHWKEKKSLPSLNEKETEILMKQSVIDYFKID